jgi:hypothetical protein
VGNDHHVIAGGGPAKVLAGTAVSILAISTLIACGSPIGWSSKTSRVRA